MLFLLGLIWGMAAFADGGSSCSVRLECDSRVVNAATDAWRDAKFGFSELEAGFCVLHTEKADGSCDIEIERLPYTGENRKITFQLNPRCIAIFHTHPNTSIPNPSEGDRLTADH